MVSVIIPTYNSVKCIRRAIDSVLAQTYSDYEIIVVDDGSTDNTAQVVKSYGGKVRYIYQENAGVSVARNTGIAAAKGQWIAFLDADDEWLPEKLKKQMELLARCSELVWCATNYYQSDGKSRKPRISVSSLEKALAGREYIENYFAEAARKRCHIGTPTVVVHRTVFEDLGGFEPGRAAGEDFDMWCRIAFHYPRVGFISSPLVTVHLDVDIPFFTTRRLATKSGANARQLIAKQLDLARQFGKLDSFKPYARMLLKQRLFEAIYWGYREEPRAIVRQFKNLFPAYLRLGTYLLTAFPKLTSTSARALSFLAHRLGLERRVTRRWLYPKSVLEKRKCQNEKSIYRIK